MSTEIYKPDYTIALRKKAHVFSLDPLGKCVLCGLVRGAECHAYYSYMELDAAK